VAVPVIFRPLGRRPWIWWMASSRTSTLLMAAVGISRSPCIASDLSRALSSMTSVSSRLLMVATRLFLQPGEDVLDDAVVHGTSDLLLVSLQPWFIGLGSQEVGQVGHEV
jgi:hypothetical protein